MEYVQRAVYGHKHTLSHLMHDRVHAADDNRTLCGKLLDENWFITGDSKKSCKTITCPICRNRAKEE